MDKKTVARKAAADVRAAWKKSSKLWAAWRVAERALDAAEVRAKKAWADWEKAEANHERAAEVWAAEAETWAAWHKAAAEAKAKGTDTPSVDRRILRD